MLSRKFEFIQKPSGLIVAIPVDAIEWVNPAPEAAQPTPSSTSSPTLPVAAKAAAKPARRRVRLRPTLWQARGDLRR